MTTTTQNTPLHSGQVLDSMTGYDEQAVEKQFGTEVLELAGSKLLRALLFVTERQAGKSDADALKAVQGLTISQVKERFSSEGAEDPELPGSAADQGND